jgi:hypothetical protein
MVRLAVKPFPSSREVIFHWLQLCVFALTSSVVWSADALSRAGHSVFSMAIGVDLA